jgi:Zn-dependent protease with chaperone function
MLFVSLHLFSKKFRQQETECDLSALNYGYGEAMKSALAKTNANIVQSKWQIRLSKIMPKIHPTGEERIRDIQAAMNRKKTIDYVV